MITCTAVWRRRPVVSYNEERAEGVLFVRHRVKYSISWIFFVCVCALCKCSVKLHIFCKMFVRIFVPFSVETHILCFSSGLTEF